jgi:hypothetical protein
LSTAEFHGVLPQGAMTWSQTNMNWRAAQFRYWHSTAVPAVTTYVRC